MATEYGIHVKTASGTVEVLKPGIDRRVTALENKNGEQDTAITNAQNTANEAKQNSANATKWNGAAKTVSQAAPSGGANNDIWIQYIA